MMFTPLGGMIGGGIPALTAPMGGLSVTIGGLALGLLVLTGLVILIAGRRSSS